MPRHRHLRLPVDVAERLALVSGERALAWATDAAGHWYVGTSRALHLAEGDGFRVLPWEQIERADWQQETNRLAVVESDTGEGGAARTEITVAQEGRLLELLQERVTKSVLTTVYAAVDGRQGLTVVARRSPTGQGPVSWSYVLSRGLDPADPHVVAVAERAKSEAQEQLDRLV